MLFRLGRLTSDGLALTFAHPPLPGEPALKTWWDHGLVDEDAFTEAYAWQAHLPWLRTASLTPQAGLAMLVPEPLALARQILPLWWVKDALVIAIPAGNGVSGQAACAPLPALPGIPLRPVVCSPSAWERMYRHIYLHGLPGPDAGYSRGERAVVRRLQKQGLISGLDLDGARAIQRQTGRTISEIGIEQGLFTRDQWLRAASQAQSAGESRLALPPQGSRKPTGPAWQPSPLASRLLPADLARAFSIVPLEIRHDRLILGMSCLDPHTLGHIHSLAETVTGMPVEPRSLDPARLDEYLRQAYPDPVHQPAPVEYRPVEYRLEDVLLAMGLVTGPQLEEALQASLEQDDARGSSPGESLVRLGYLDHTDLAEAQSVLTGLPWVTLEHAHCDPGAASLIPTAAAQKHQVLPFVLYGNDLWVLTANPLDGAGLREVEAFTGMRVWPIVAPQPVVSAGFGQTYEIHTRPADRNVEALVRVFVQRGRLTQVEAAQALKHALDGHLPLDQAIIAASRLTEDQVCSELAAHLKIPRLDLGLVETEYTSIDPLGKAVTRRRITDPVEEETARLIDLGTALRCSALPVKRRQGRVVVAFASPPLDASVRELEARLGEDILPCLAPRTELEGAIQRVLGRQNLGTRLLLDGAINRRQLNEALELAQRSGVRLGRALLIKGFVNEEQLYGYLARQTGLPLTRLDPARLDHETVRLIDAETARRHGMLPLAVDETTLTLAVVDPFNEAAWSEAVRQLPAMQVPASQVDGEKAKRRLVPVLVTEQDLEAALERVYSADYLSRSIIELLERSPEDSAYRVLSRLQVVVLAIGLLVTAVGLLLDYRLTLVVLNALATLFYLSFSAYKFYLVYRSMSNDLEVPVTAQEVSALQEQELPVWTLLVPVYREAGVLPDLLEALTRLDYPATKLDVKVLLEEDDPNTILAFYQNAPPPHIQAVIVPESLPKTKPKACNYGLIHARGEYVVIFDAEDLPDRDQLKRIYAAFRKSPPEVVCIQSKLNYYNSHQNLLTRWFTVEYSMWFDLFLPGLDAARAPIPLGGTSNHFKHHALIEAGAWDPFNVTEDADLGIRLFKRGYRTAIVDSTTYEEANGQLNNWLRQRSRWIKGYIQTWLVHMRHPVNLLSRIGWKAFLGFQFVVGGTFFAALLNPVYWLLTTLWFLGKWEFIQMLFPGPVFFFGAICLYLGNFAFTYMNVAGAMRRGYYDLVKYALLSPLYWGLMSVAAWRGLFQLVSNPHYWEKTQHGLFQGEPSPTAAEKTGTVHP
jgi:cellulose synthase/poly-beta-1,6-N-acetylglucosamine synthase-like glycosyltransferase